MKLPGAKDYPAEIHVCDETYTIKIVARIPGEDGKTSGLCDGGTKTIYIRSRQSKSQMFRTFIHEVLHALEFEYRIPLKHEVVYQLEKAIGDLFLANF